MDEKHGEAKVREALVAFCAKLQDLPADHDLIESRLINSLTFITCVQHLIDFSGVEPDLDAVPIEKLRTIKGLAEIFFPAEARAAQMSE